MVALQFKHADKVDLSTMRQGFEPTVVPADNHFDMCCLNRPGSCHCSTGKLVIKNKKAQENKNIFAWCQKDN